MAIITSLKELYFHGLRKRWIVSPFKIEFFEDAFALLQHFKPQYVSKFCIFTASEIMSGVFFPALTEPWATRRRRCTASTRPSSTSRRRSPEPTGPRVSQIPRPHFFPSYPCYPLSFGLSFSAAHLRADWLPMIGARQPSGLNYCSLLTAAYPTEGRSKHDEAEAVLPQFF